MKKRPRRKVRGRPLIGAPPGATLSPQLKNLYKVAIVPARDEAETIGDVVRSLRELPLDEVIVVANGCSDNTAEIADEAGARVLSVAEPLGHDVGRAMGAAYVDADLYLFTDADIVLPSSFFVPFLNAVADGVDVALNDLESIATLRSRSHVVNLSKRFLNTAMGLEHLGINSMTAIPHALSRRAVKAIGTQNLAVPPRAMVMARRANLNIQAVASINVNSRNRVRPKVHRPGLGPMDELIIGDHLEALSVLLREDGTRGKFQDLDRDRRSLTKCSLLEFLRF